MDKNVQNKTKIAKKYGSPKNSLSTILKAWEKIFGSGNSSSKSVPSLKYFRKSKYLELKKALLIWLRKISRINIPIDGNMLKEQANCFAVKLNIKVFKASDGWLQTLKIRNLKHGVAKVGQWIRLWQTNGRKTNWYHYFPSMLHRKFSTLTKQVYF